MRYVFLMILFTLSAFAFPAAAADSDEREAFYGTWGTENQCARALIKPGGTVTAEPFEINADWLRQGRLWCRLNWFSVETSADGLSSGAHAQCGEDSVRDYSLRIGLSGGDLTLRWNLLLKNGPLKLCPRP